MAETVEGFRAALQRRSDRIKKAAQLLELEFGPVFPNGFSVTGYWRGGRHSHTFTKDVIFRRKVNSEPKWKIRPCRAAQFLITEFLKRRDI